MARILVIGRGVFGSLAARELTARGHETTLASRSTGLDLRDEGALRDALRQVDAVLHAAGPFQEQPPSVARAAAAAGVPYADLSDDAAFSARVRDVASSTPLMTGMSTTPAVAEALLALARRRAPLADALVAMYVGGANRQGPATLAFAAQARAPGRSRVVDLPGVGRRRAYPARAPLDAPFYVAVGGLAGLGWRSRALLRLAAPLAARLPRPGRDTAGALVALAGEAREGLHAPRDGQRLAVLPAIWAIEEALAGRGPSGAALPREWADPDALVGFLSGAGFTRTSR